MVFSWFLVRGQFYNVLCENCYKKTVVFLILLACILMPGISFGRQPFSGFVKKIIDGDSMIVSVKKTSIEVRLYGIDCPEYDQPFAKQAKKFVKSRLKRKKILVQPQYHDSYGRLVAVVSYGNTVLNAEIVESGLAWVYPKYCKKGFCKSWKRLERNAKRMDRGIWLDTKPLPPWEWRRNKK